MTKCGFITFAEEIKHDDMYSIYVFDWCSLICQKLVQVIITSLTLNKRGRQVHITFVCLFPDNGDNFIKSECIQKFINLKYY